MAKVLLIDDDPLLCRAVESMIKNMGNDCTCAYSGASGITLLRDGHFDIIFLDINLPEGNSIEQIPQLVALDPDADIVMLTGEDKTEYISDAFAAGAKDYLVKPVNAERIRLVVNSLMQHKPTQDAGVDTLLSREDIIGESPVFLQCLERLRVAAMGKGNVLITGETGTGKELFAKALHKNSDRAKNRYIVVDCTNLPSTLAGSLLFGHAKGSFTGADKTRKGLFQMADGGTLFLDEIGDLDLEIQKSLLRVLQEKTFRPLSFNEEVHSDFRLVAATNRNLKEMVDQKLFRSDLYYRLLTFTVELPPLRSRKSDIDLLVHHYVPILCRGCDIEVKAVDQEFIDTLRMYDWPGNVRELVNVLEVAIQKAIHAKELNIYHLPQQLLMYRAFSNIKNARDQEEEPRQEAVTTSSSWSFATTPGEFPAMREVRQAAVNNMEEAYLRQLVQLSHSSAVTACELSGLSRARLYELLQKHNISLRSN